MSSKDVWFCTYAVTRATAKGPFTPNVWVNTDNSVKTTNDAAVIESNENGITGVIAELLKHWLLV